MDTTSGYCAVNGMVPLDNNFHHLALTYDSSKSQFNALTRVQSETLDSLKEGVGVFGTDGRLKFFNPAFASLLNLDPNLLNEKPHIDRLAGISTLFGGDAVFDEIRAIVVGLTDQRTGFERRIACCDG